MNKGIQCCNGCTESTGRELGCHSTCKRYKSEKLLYEARKKLIRQNKSTDLMFIELAKSRNN